MQMQELEAGEKREGGATSEGLPESCPVTIPHSCLMLSLMLDLHPGEVRLTKSTCGYSTNFSGRSFINKGRGRAAQRGIAGNQNPLPQLISQRELL